MPDETAELYGLDPDPDRGHPDVPIAVDGLDGRTVTVEGKLEGQTERVAGVAVVIPDLHRTAAWMKREGERMIRCWRAGNLIVWARPMERGHPAVVRIRDEEGVERFEELRWPVWNALDLAMRAEGSDRA
jgi:hypothetical protein